MNLGQTSSEFETGSALRRLHDLTRSPESVPSSDFDLNGDSAIFGPDSYAPAAVLVPFVERKGALSVILTKRTAHLRHHPGQVAFPGGKMDAGDSSVGQTALREAEEEIGLPPANVDLIGNVAPHKTVTGFDVTPVLGLVTAPFTPRPEAGEVEQVFEVPLRFLLDPANERIDGRHWRGSFRRYYVIPYGPFYIWGATARMIVGLRELWHKTP